MIDKTSNDEHRLANLFDELAMIVQKDDEASVDEFLLAHPQFESQLRGLLPTIRAMVGMGNVSETHGSSETTDAGLVPMQRELGDFCLIREVGRGGMGVVYEAEQRSMGRRVALKILPFAAVIDRRQVERFRNEVRAAAALQHQNIVPVYSVGCENGVHYYAMQFIDGPTLTDVVAGLLSEREINGRLRREDSGILSELSTARSAQRTVWYRSVTQLMIQAADALAHAHSRGVLHRDIKPGNLMVDTSGNLWVSDFGLAKFDADSNLTMSGDLVGTLRYVSPEQSQGVNSAVDERSDVYSLGATMYELMALRPAFDATNRHHLLRQIGEHDPKPLRRLDPSIPRELEIIIHKALEKIPSNRYASAHALADDLRRFLDHRPILAKAPSVVDRIRKWSLRHIGLVWTSLAASVLMVFVLLITALMISASRNDAREAEAVAQRRLRRALEAEKTAARHAQHAEDAKRESDALLYAADVRLAADSLENGTIGRGVERLLRHIPQDADLDRRGFAWNYLWDQLHPELATWKTTNPVFCIRFSPDGRLLAVGSGDGHVIIRGANDGQVLRRLAFHTDIVRDLAFSADGNLLATASDDGHVGLWNVARGELLKSVSTQPNDAVGVCFSPDSDILFYTNDNFVHVWRLGTELPPSKLPAHPGKVHDLDVASDGQRLAVASSTPHHHHFGQVTVWNLADLDDEVTYEKLKPEEEWYVRRKCISIAFTHDGSRVAVGTQLGQVIVWDFDSLPHPVLMNEEHASNIYDIAFSHDDQILATASKDNTIRLCDSNSGDEMATMHGHAGRVYGLDFAPDRSQLASASSDATIKMWRPSHDSFSLRQISSYKSEHIRVAKYANRVALAASWKLRTTPDLSKTPDHVFEAIKDLDCAWLGENRLVRLPKFSRWPRSRGSRFEKQIQIADVDADGDQDRIGGFEESNRMIWQENVGDRFMPPRIRVSGDIFRYQQVRIPIGTNQRLFTMQTNYGGGDLLLYDDKIEKENISVPLPTALDIGDLNHDGLVDWVCASRNPGHIFFGIQSPGNGDRYFSDRQVAIELDDASAVMTIEGSVDGQCDLIAGSYDAEQLVLLRNLSDLRFKETTRLSTSPVRPMFLEHEDIDRDGVRDLVVAGTEGIWYFRGTGEQFSTTSEEIKTLDNANWVRRLPGNVQVVDASSEIILRQFHSGDESLSQAAASERSQRIATLSRDYIVRTWDENGTPLASLDTASTRVLAMEFCRDGKFLCLAKGDDVLVLESENLKQVFRLTGHQNTIESVCISHRNDLIVSVSHDQTAKIWSLKNGAHLQNLAGHSSRVLSAAFSQDDRLVATGDTSGMVKIWDVYTGQELLELADFPCSVLALKFDSTTRLTAWGTEIEGNTPTYEGVWEITRQLPKRTE